MSATSTHPEHLHAVVWIDHHEARVAYFDGDAQSASQRTIHAGRQSRHLHHKANSIGSGHSPVDHQYLDSVADALAGAAAVLIAGPSSAKQELWEHLKARRPQMLSKIAGVEAADHPTQGELLAHAVRFFRAYERLGRAYVPGESQIHAD